MPRGKEIIKKRRHEVGSSSRAQEEIHVDRENVVAEPRRLRGLNAIQLAKVEELRLRATILGGYYFDFPLLDTYGCRERVEMLASRPYWTQVFQWRGDTYAPLIYEFVATLEVNDNEKNHARPSISFTLFGKNYHISVNDLGVLLGFYTKEQINTPWYTLLSDDFAEPTDMERYWRQITSHPDERFAGGRTLTSHITPNALKVIKLLLALTFGGRWKNLHKVYTWDLFLLRSIDEGRDINMGVVCRRWLHSQSGERCPYIFIGPLLAQLCRGLNLERKMLQEERIASMGSLSAAELSRGNLLRMDDIQPPVDVPMLPPPEGHEQHEMPHEDEIPPHFRDVNDWASMRAFQYQLYSNMMNRFDQQDETLARMAEENARRAEENAGFRTQLDEMQQMFMNHFYPPSSGGDGSSH